MFDERRLRGGVRHSRPVVLCRPLADQPLNVFDSKAAPTPDAKADRHEDALIDEPENSPRRHSKQGGDLAGAEEARSRGDLHRHRFSLRFDPSLGLSARPHLMCGFP
jgi:hypothetical protein